MALRKESHPIDKNTMISLLDKLADKLAAANKNYELICAGGCVSVLYLGNREQTDDVDVKFETLTNLEDERFIRKAAEEVANEFNWPNKRWLNFGLGSFGLRKHTPRIFFYSKPGLSLMLPDWGDSLYAKLSRFTARDKKDVVAIVAKLKEKDQNLTTEQLVNIILEGPRERNPKSVTDERILKIMENLAELGVM
jgi:hypothetical protein